MKIFRSANFRKWALIAAVPLVLISAKIGDEFFEISKNMEIFNSLYKELNIYYVDETKPGALMKTGIDAMLKSLDPYTVYYPESKIEDYRYMTTGEYGGIGTLVNTIDGRITIVEPYKGYPAEKAGMRAGDVVIKVNGKSVIGKNHTELEDQMSGQAGTEVEITVTRTGVVDPIIFKLKREEVQMPDVPYYDMMDAQMGYIKLTGFTARASSDVRNAYMDLKKRGMQQLVLDLRGNGGGLLRESVNIVNFFVPKGTEVVRTKGKITEWNKTYSALNEPLDTEIPLIVLIDPMSASASEIVSGSLQDLDRAVVLGEESFGKGLVQQTKDIAYNTKLKLTVAKYYTPSGRCIQRLDYAHRAATGEVTAVSDSLVKAFTTRNGRTVFDGRGVRPDVEVLNSDTSHILGALVGHWVIFDWATEYRNKHEQIDSSKFELSDVDFAQFAAFAANKDFEYETYTEVLFREMEQAAKSENYFVGSEKEFEVLKNKIKPDKRTDISRFESSIRPIIENEIYSRYYFQNGRIRYGLKEDPSLLKAREVFDRQYAVILKAPSTGK